MEILNGLNARPSMGSTSVVTIGAFAVIHRGHRSLITRVCQEAARLGSVPSVVTFTAHPLETLAPNRAPCILATVDQRLESLEHLGIQRVLLIDFTPQIAALEPDKFVVRALVEALRARKVVVGSDFRFGHNRAGTPETLKELGAEYEFETEVLDLIEAPDGKVSASQIRRLLEAGNVSEANQLLGENFELAGRVVEGTRQAAQLGFPTANLALQSGSCLPGFGIYAGRFVSARKRLDGVVYVGIRPTLGGGSGPSVEIHIFDFDQKLYGSKGAIEFVEKLRDDQKFDSVSELKHQMGIDAQSARKVLRQ